jgi:hypothetical protein
MKKQLVALYVSATVAAAMQAAAADSTDQSQVQEVQVTGTRIQHVGMTTPTPAMLRSVPPMRAAPWMWMPNSTDMM